MTMPNFLIIGAAKSGTSALYQYLRQHPDVFMSPRKETHFFAFENRDPNTNGIGDTIPDAITHIEDYRALFSQVTTEKAIGEASPTYIYIPYAAERIKYHIPNARMIILLRNPVDRAYSAYMHLVRDGRESISNFAEALEQESYRIANNWGPIWHYKAGGLYYKQVRYYFDMFDLSQFKIYLHEDLNNQPKTVLQDSFQFIGVDDQWEPDVSFRVNVSGKPKNKLLQQTMHYFFLQPNPVRFASRKFIPEIMRWRFTSAMRNRNLEKTGVPEQFRLNLIDYFREDIIQLQELIKRDLSAWLVP